MPSPTAVMSDESFSGPARPISTADSSRSPKEAGAARLLSADPPLMPFAASLACSGPAGVARSHGQAADKRSKRPDRLPAIRPLTCNYLVAGAGFEPACDTRSHALSERVEEVG